MGILYPFPQLHKRLGVRESDSALVLGNTAFLRPSDVVNLQSLVSVQETVASPMAFFCKLLETVRVMLKFPVKSLVCKL